ncbi:MFS transporter [Chloroflexota bacterium]
MMMEGISHQGIPVLYPFIQTDLALSNSQIGLITSTLNLMGLFVVMFGGWLADVFGVKKVILLSLLSVTAIIAILPFAQSFIVLLLIVAIIGVANTPTAPATSAAVSLWIPNRILGFAMSFKQTGFAVGGAIAAAILPALSLIMGWRLAGGTISIIIVIVAIIFWIYYRDAPVKKDSPVIFSLGSFIKDIKVMVRNRRLLICLSWGTIFGGLQWVFLSYFLLFLINNMGFSPILAGGMLALSQIINSVSRVFWGAISDLRIFRGNRIVILVIIGVISIFTLFSFSLLKPGASVLFIYILTITTGLSLLAWPGMLMTVSSEMTDQNKVGATVGLMVTFYRLGVVIIPPIFGWLIDTSNSYQAGWQMAAGLALISTLILIIFGRQSPRSA